MTAAQTEFQKNRDRAMGIVDLEFDDSVIASSQTELMAMFDRVERGESTFEQEDAALMLRWRELKQRQFGISLCRFLGSVQDSVSTLARM